MRSVRRVNVPFQLAILLSLGTLCFHAGHSLSAYDESQLGTQESVVDVWSNRISIVFVWNENLLVDVDPSRSISSEKHDDQAVVCVLPAGTCGMETVHS